MRKVYNELDCRIVTTHIGVVPADDSDPVYAVLLDALREIGAWLAIETDPEKIAMLTGLVERCG